VLDLILSLWTIYRKNNSIKIEEANTNSGFIDKIALTEFQKFGKIKESLYACIVTHDYDDAIKVFDKAIEIDRKIQMLGIIKDLLYLN